MNRKAGVIALAVLLVICASALGFANEGRLFTGPGVNERADDNSDGPPPWAPEIAHKAWEWSQKEDKEGPPDWVPGFVRERSEWSQDKDSDNGPPDWVPGPPPWAQGKGNGNQ